MTTNINTPESTIAALGFTEIEAGIYCELLRGGVSTGYRLAQAIGKAPANVYQALANLAHRGAVMVDDGDTKSYRATPPAELLGGLQRVFDKSRHEAQSALAALQTATVDDRIYQLKVPSQIYERAARMIADARETLLFDLFSEPLERLTPLLMEAHARGVTVAGLAYGETPKFPFPVVRARSRAVVAGRWPGLQLSLVADAREHLVALLSHDGLTARHGVWSDSVYLACLQHSGLAAEIQLSTANPSDPEAFSKLSLLHAYPPGLRALIGPRTAD